MGKDIFVFGRDTEHNPFWREWVYPRGATRDFNGEVTARGDTIGINIEG